MRIQLPGLPQKFRTFCRSFLKVHWLLCFLVLTFAYLELLFRAWIFKNLSADYFFALFFGITAGSVLYLLINIIPARAARTAAAFIIFLLSLCYAIQLVYFSIFHTPLSFVSLRGAGDALQMQDIVVNGILKNLLVIVLIFSPVVLFLMQGKKLALEALKRGTLALLLFFCVLTYFTTLLLVNLTGNSPASQKTLYYKASSPELSVSKLGLFTTMRLDFGRFATGILQEGFNGNVDAWTEGSGRNTQGSDEENPGTSVSDTANSGATNPVSSADSEAGSGETTAAAILNEKKYNVMDIDFVTLMAKGKQDADYALHKYFSAVEPTATNEYTGRFKGYNLILLTAEGFSPYAINKELTPVLYKMSTEGFVFNNFYNPVWWVSTSDGEYVACTGLIPKSGVWSFAASGRNSMPFTLGNQFGKLGYMTKAYHDHTYTYYKRNISHPNMGYDYKGVGNGLNIKKTWPESDLEMINVTADEYIGQQPFHTYYMTVSGHMNYSFSGNYMAGKNRALVADLPYSDTSRAYIACNLELEFALEALIGKLEEAGIAEKTVIALSADHYPYGLPKENIDELAGHVVESNFELYKSTFILWKKGMETVVIDKPCASMDILPTLSNLFGLDYDSRLLMGRDILSDSAPLVIFSNRSWITDRASYNSVTDTAEFVDGTTEDKAYINKINKVVADKFKYSALILDSDYYSKAVP